MQANSEITANTVSYDVFCKKKKNKQREKTEYDRICMTTTVQTFVSSYENTSRKRRYF